MQIKASGSLTQQISILIVGILFGLLVISCQIEKTEGRPTGEDGFFAEPVMKRNTWWSKKSLDALKTIGDVDMTRQMKDRCENSLQNYICYVERCVPNLVACLRQSPTDDVFAACKMLHKMCASDCATANQDSDEQL